METIEKAEVKRELIPSFTLWEDEGTLCFNFEDNTILDLELVNHMFDYYGEAFSKNGMSTLLNLDGVLGASLDGLKLLNEKLEAFSSYKAILVNNEKTDIIGRIMANSFKNNIPTKVFKSALQAEFWMN